MANGNVTRSQEAHHYESDACSPDWERPGKPNASGYITTNSIVINWTKPNTTIKTFQYEVRGKLNTKNRWKYYEKLYKRCSARIKNLQRNTEYVFQVRIVADDQDIDFPWSERSNAIKTKQSAAYLLISNTNFCTVINPNETPKMGKLKFVKGDRDETAKIRRLLIGQEDTSYTEDKTILFLGESGAGKSTLTNMLMNHITAVDWTDEFRLTMVDLEKDEQNRASHQSQTRWITIYSVAPFMGGRLNYRLNVIDTPGFGDTERSELDIDTQIRTLFNAENNVSLHAVCIVIKGSNNRLNSNQMKLFKRILSIFGRDIIRNIVVMITHNTTQHNPPVLAVLKEAKVPFEKYFSFNNEPFSERTDIAEIAWGFSNDSFKSFFEYINTLPPCSLHLTRDLVNKMVLAENEIRCLTMLLRDRLPKRSQIEQEMRTLERCQKEIEAMKISIDKSKQDMSYRQLETDKTDADIKELEEHFKKMQVKRTIYEICTRDIPEPDKAINCKICRSTCAPDAGVAKYIPIWFSGTMSFFGKCKRCVKECHSTNHSVDSFEYVTEVKEVVENLGHRLTEFINEKQRYFAQSKAEADKISEELFKEEQKHSNTQCQIDNLTKYIDTYKADLRKMERNVEKTMTDLHQSFDILVKNQLKKKHHSLREYLESWFDDEDKAEFLKELEPYL